MGCKKNVECVGLNKRCQSCLTRLGVNIRKQKLKFSYSSQIQISSAYSIHKKGLLFPILSEWNEYK